MVAIPDNVSFSEAAAIWVAYGTAWGGLVAIGALGAGQTVLIPAASSSVGLAAIHGRGAHPSNISASRVRAGRRGSTRRCAARSSDRRDEAQENSNGRGNKLAFSLRKCPGTALIPVDDVVDNLPFIVRRDQAKMDRARAGFPKIHTFRSDVSDPEAIATLYEKVTKQFPDLNMLINNAGIMRAINVHDKAGSLEDITREIEINLNGPIRMVKQFLPHLKTKSEAAIMNVSSGLAFVPLPISPVYCATKAGLHSFTESLRVQLKNTKVRVFELAPPATQTELLDDFSVEDMKGASIMKVEDMVQVAVKGMQTDRFEIRPGQANQLKMMNRLAPGFILKQMSRSVDRMLRTQN